MWPRLVVTTLLAATALHVLHRLALWAEARGWIYYTRRGSSGSLGNAFLEVQALFEPNQRHVLEERQRAEEKEEEDDEGDPPRPGA